jgi:hypothetical protein
MAKLSARGRECLWTLSLEKEVTDSTSVEWEKDTYKFMSDGHLLWKHEARFMPSPHRASYTHSYGWKDKGKETRTSAEVKQLLESKGFK